MGSEGLEKFTEYQNEVIEEAFKKIMTDSNITKVNIYQYLLITINSL